MKIELRGKDNYNIFINGALLKEVSLTDKEGLIQFIKKFILKIKNRLNLHGFYKVKVIPNKKIGVFLDIIKLDDLDLANTLDLRVVVFLDEPIYYETNDYELVENCNDKRYFEDKFYCIVDDCFEGILEKVEFGRFIYGKEIANILNKGLIL